MSGEQHTHRQVAIVGGGIGGIATAAFFRRTGIACCVYEQASRLAEVGAGIVMAPNAVRLVRSLGLGAQLAQVGVRVETGWEFRRWDSAEVLLAQDMTICRSRYGEHAWLIHRADLLGMLLSAIDPAILHLGRRVVALRDAGHAVILEFADGQTAQADLVIGADGIHSVVRAAVARSAPPRSAGVCAWRALLPVEQVPALARLPVQTLWLGPGRHLVHYPVSAGAKLNVVAFTPAGTWRSESWTTDGDPAELAAEFAGWNARLTDLVQCVTQVSRWAVYDREPIDRYVHGRIVLMGDAAHPMLPFYAQGACQALEDAAALAASITAPGVDLDLALEAYDAVRVPRATEVQEASRGRLTSNHLPDGPQQRERDAAFATQDALRHSDWLYGYDAEQAALQQIAALRRSTGRG